MAQLIEQYRGLVEMIEPASIVPTVLADPDDDQVLAAALAAGADVIVSGDTDLQALGTYQDIPILSAAECLQRLGGDSRE